MADFYELIGMIQKEYPQIFAILSKPGILDVALQIVQAEIDQRPWTANQIEAALQATSYYQTTNQAGRTWDVQNALDPASARSAQDARAKEIGDFMQQAGLMVTPDEAKYLAGVSLSNGDTAEVWQYNILHSQYGQDRLSVSMPAANQVEQIAAQYGIPLSDQSVTAWAQKLILGEVTLDNFDAYAKEQAKSLYPSLSDAIDAGITVRQYADPYAQIAARELGINPNDFNLADPKWSAPLTQIDPSSGARTAMTLQSWQSHIRSDPTYGYDTTTGARDQAAQFATNLAQQFGAQG